MSLTNWSLDEIAMRCKEETEKFRQRLQNDTKYCYELCRRALHLNQNDAFTEMFRTYERIVKQWVYRTGYFAHVDEEADLFVADAFTRLYEHLLGERFLGFKTIQAILAYLRACAFSAVQDYWRKLFPLIYIVEEDELEGEESLIDYFSLYKIVELKTLWEYIESLLPDEATRRLARYCYQFNLKPSAIVELESTWGDERDVSVARQYIRRILSRDDDLRDWLGGVADEDDPDDLAPVS